MKKRQETYLHSHTPLLRKVSRFSHGYRSFPGILALIKDDRGPVLSKVCLCFSHVCFLLSVLSFALKIRVLSYLLLLVTLYKSSQALVLSRTSSIIFECLFIIFRCLFKSISSFRKQANTWAIILRAFISISILSMLCTCLWVRILCIRKVMIYLQTSFIKTILSQRSPSPRV